MCFPFIILHPRQNTGVAGIPFAIAQFNWTTSVGSAPARLLRPDRITTFDLGPTRPDTRSATRLSVSPSRCVVRVAAHNVPTFHLNHDASLAALFSLLSQPSRIVAIAVSCAAMADKTPENPEVTAPVAAAADAPADAPALETKSGEAEPAAGAGDDGAKGSDGKLPRRLFNACPTPVRRDIVMRRRGGCSH
jgi:hypothetical protein